MHVRAYTPLLSRARVELATLQGVEDNCVLSRTPGEEKAEEGAAHKIVVILLHLSFINAGLDWLVERKKCPRLHAPHKFGYTRKHRRRWAGGKGCRVTVCVFESAGMVTRQVYRQVYRLTHRILLGMSW